MPKISLSTATFEQSGALMVAIWRIFVTFVVDYDNSRKGFCDEYNDNKEEASPRAYIRGAAIVRMAWP